MNLLKLILCVSLLSLVGCAGTSSKLHKPNPKSTAEIAKGDGLYAISIITGDTPSVERLLNSYSMKCGSGSFTMPRGHTVDSFIKEIFEQELEAAQKLSVDGTPIEVVIKSVSLTTTKEESGEWNVDVNYLVRGRTINVKTSIEFESKLSVLSACSYTASIFEEAIADNLVEFFKRFNK